MVFKYLKYFYGYLKYRIIILVFFGAMVGVLDGIGITFVIPLLEFISNKEAQFSGKLMGNLSRLLEPLKHYDIDLNINLVLIFILTIFLIKAIFNYYDGYFRIIYKHFFVKNLRLEAIAILENLKYSKFAALDAGRLQNLFSGEIQKVSNAFASMNSMVIGILKIVSYLILAVYANSKFTLFVIIGIVISSFVFTKIFRRTKSISKKMVKSKNIYHKYLLEAINNFKYLKSTKTNTIFFQKVRQKIFEIEDQVIKSGMLSNIINALKEPLILCVLIFTVYSYLKFSEGDFNGIVLSLLFFYRSLNHLNATQSNYNNFLSNSGSIDEIIKYKFELSKYLESKDSFFSLTRNDVLIQLDNIEFNYSDNNPILKGVTLTLKRNEILGIVGITGSGKTTLVNIMCGLIEPTSGSIKSNVKAVGYITQEPVVFDDTIYNNITMWDIKSEYNKAKFLDVLKNTNLLQFVNSLNLKEDTKLGNNGVKLSGGQRQRISIARELYRDIDLLIADEATSALDSKNENFIKTNLEELRNKLALIIISHRFSILNNADRILFLKNGIIYADGPFEYLLENYPEFRSLAELQNLQNE